jgi:hypothetical protein
MKMIIALSLTLLFAANMETARGKTWLVDDDGGPGVRFTDIPPAIVEVPAGDTLLVRNGKYSGFLLEKSLIILADSGHHPAMFNYEDSTIAHIPAGGSVVISGFSMAISNCLRVSDCQGSVVIDDCEIDGSTSDPALTIQDCSMVSLSRLHVTGEYVGSWTSYPFEEGARFRNSTVIVSECLFEGGEGMDEWGDDAYPGTPAITSEDCKLFVQATSALGGRGGSVTGIEPYGYGGDGAPGIDMKNTDLELFGLPTHEIRGGSGGSGWYGNGDCASAVVVSGGSLAYSGVTFTTYGGKPHIQGNTNLTHVSPDVPVITLSGTGHLGLWIRPSLNAPLYSDYLLFASARRSVLELNEVYAHFLLDPFQLLLLAYGNLQQVPYTKQFTLPNVPGWKGIPVHLQALVQPMTGSLFISTSASFVLR